MRRKSGASQKKTPPKSESPKPTRRSTRSSRKLYRSPSLERESEIEHCESPSDKSVAVEEANASPEIAENNEKVNVENVIEECEARDGDDGMEDDAKGKSKGIVNRDDDGDDDEKAPRHNVETEIENDNVQGTTRSPSHETTINETDQKSNDEPPNSEEVPDVEVTPDSNTDTVREEQEQSFQSEYVQEPEPCNISKSGEVPQIPEIKDLSNSEGQEESNEKTHQEERKLSEDQQQEQQQQPTDIETTEKKNGENLTTPLEPNVEEEHVIKEEKTREEPKPPEKAARRLSTITDEKPHVNEDKPGRFKGRINRASVLYDEETGPPTEPPVPRGPARWYPEGFVPQYPDEFKVTLNFIRKTLGAVHFLREDEVLPEIKPPEPRQRPLPEEDTVMKNASGDETEKTVSENPSSEQTNKNIIALNRRISIVDDSVGKLRAPPSPAKNPVSEVLFITNLVRPYTVKQLKELLERTGTIREDGFWTDRIKSKCYVYYMNTEEAEATRNALHGINWPPGNGKQLVIDYATVEDLEKAKNPPPPIPPIVTEPLPEKENREPEIPVNRYFERDHLEVRRRSLTKEFDGGKEDERRSRSRSRERVRKHSHRSYTPEDVDRVIKKFKKEEPQPQKLMDDLFLKTKASPSVYWQPLSPEEIATKQKQRMVRMEEHKRRVEDRERRMRAPRRPPFRRR